MLNLPCYVSSISFDHTIQFVRSSAREGKVLMKGKGGYFLGVEDEGELQEINETLAKVDNILFTQMTGEQTEDRTILKPVKTRLWIPGMAFEDMIYFTGDREDYSITEGLRLRKRIRGKYSAFFDAPIEAVGCISPERARFYASHGITRETLIKALENSEQVPISGNNLVFLVSKNSEALSGRPGEITAPLANFISILDLLNLDLSKPQKHPYSQ